jgi:farnesyl diphosphate synthase
MGLASVLVLIRQNLNYNTPGGKLNRGMSVVDTVEILKGRSLTEDEYFKSAVLGWCVELVSATYPLCMLLPPSSHRNLTRRSSRRTSSSQTI